MLWANGLGTTLEVCTSPSTIPWDWRLSIAEIHQDGPFSILPGIDRALLVAQGAGMTLHLAGVAHSLGLFEGVEFSGDLEARATLKDGPVRDLNLMVRRDASIGRPVLEVVHVEKGECIAVKGALALVVLDGFLAMDSSDGAVPAGHLDVFLSDALVSNGPSDTHNTTSITAVTAAVAVLAKLVVAGRSVGSKP